MIASQDRSGYFGASDTSTIVGNWNTKSFENWWMVKLGLKQHHLVNEAIQAGNNYEHDILKALDIEDLEMDKQIIIDRLRVNLDGNTKDTIYEVKTHKTTDKYEPFKVPKNYWRQVQVQMYASGLRNCYIVVYNLTDEDYKNFFNPIEKERIQFIKIDYDKDFIEQEYKPKLAILTEAIKKGVFPWNLQPKYQI